jgi:hypothetical protein
MQVAFERFVLWEWMYLITKLFLKPCSSFITSINNVIILVKDGIIACTDFWKLFLSSYVFDQAHLRVCGCQQHAQF